MSELVSVPEGQEVGPETSARVKDVRIIKPIIVGNTARYFGKKREEDGHTHFWTVYVKPFVHEDYSSFIKKVHFKLHDSYANPNRVVTSPPYEISETGWGEFEIVIRIHFNDPIERPVTCYHVLKLFQAGQDPTAAATVKKNIRSESYDEIVFLDPTIHLKKILDEIKPLPGPQRAHDTDFEAKKAASVQQINDARAKVKEEIQDMKEKLKLSRETISRFKEKLNAPSTPPVATSAQALKQN